MIFEVLEQKLLDDFRKIFVIVVAIASRDAPLSDRLSSIKNTPHHGSETVKSDLTINASPVLCARSYLFQLSLEDSKGS